MKVVGIHQPNYYPWMGYFYKILNSDVFVFLDSVDFQHGNASSLTNRGKIKTVAGGLLITVPVKRQLEDKTISHARIDYAQRWQKKHLTTIKINYAKSNFFKEIYPMIEEVIGDEYSSLAQLNIATISSICLYLNLCTTLVTASSLNINSKDRNLRLIEICKSLEANIYLSGNGARSYNDETQFLAKGIKIKYSDFVHPEYNQLYGSFIPKLSIIDALFNYGKDTMKLLHSSGKQSGKIL